MGAVWTGPSLAREAGCLAVACSTRADRCVARSLGMVVFGCPGWLIPVTSSGIPGRDIAKAFATRASSFVGQVAGGKWLHACAAMRSRTAFFPAIRGEVQLSNTMEKRCITWVSLHSTQATLASDVSLSAASSLTASAGIEATRIAAAIAFFSIEFPR